MGREFFWFFFFFLAEKGEDAATGDAAAGDVVAGFAAWCSIRVAGWCALRQRPNSVTGDVAVDDVVAGLPPRAPAPLPAIHGAAVNAHPRLHLRGRPVRPPPAPQLRRGPSPVGSFVAGRRSRCESGPSSYPSATLGEQRDKMVCKELVNLVMAGCGVW
uniref:Uncharacterized protein n=1 Tax=Oryza sativa subsp. japonica TaxID=39947 RepID=Q69SS3_ORYSJ|nr:hypothetical protein [Oryza sativa Japonica Group]BAD35962.1 hypothetical protein [Oryza sativa Japonica Group]